MYMSCRIYVYDGRDRTSPHEPKSEYMNICDVHTHMYIYIYNIYIYTYICNNSNINTIILYMYTIRMTECPGLRSVAGSHKNSKRAVGPQEISRQSLAPECEGYAHPARNIRNQHNKFLCIMESWRIHGRLCKFLTCFCFCSHPKRVMHSSASLQEV